MRENVHTVIADRAMQRAHVDDGGGLLRLHGPATLFRGERDRGEAVQITPSAFHAPAHLDPSLSVVSRTLLSGASTSATSEVKKEAKNDNSTRTIGLALDLIELVLRAQEERLKAMDAAAMALVQANT